MEEVEDWHKNVYGKKETAKFTSLYYRNRSKVIRRDNHECQSCFKKLGKSENSVHHIEPREDGTDEMSNLILLCKKCHDEIEGLSRLQIIGYFYQSTGNYTKPCWPADWHKWVYGAEENPYNDPLFIKLRMNGELVRIGELWWHKKFKFCQ